VVGWICSSYRREIYPCPVNYSVDNIFITFSWDKILNMDDTQQKAQIDDDARKAKEEVDTNTFNERQALADQETEKIRSDAEAEIAQIQSDAQK
jgi:hypothetical protein